MDDRTIRPKFDKGRTQSVSLPPRRNLKITKPYMPPAEEEAPAHKKTQVMGDLPPSLYLVTGSSSKDFPMDPNEFIISVGKDRKCDITIEDNQLSPTHLMMVKVQNNCLFMDRGKRDVLKFDGIHTRQACKDLESRVVIRLGKHWLVYDACSITTDTVSLNQDIVSSALSQDALPGKVSFRFHNKFFETEKNACLIGTHPICDIKLFSDSAADFTALAYWDKEGVYFDRMGACRAAVCINSKRVTKLTKLEDGDVITVGRDEIQVTFEGDVESRAAAIYGQVEMKPGLALTILSGADTNTYSLNQNSQYVLGRASTADLIVNGPSVSRQHAKIMVRDKFLSITDNNSFNKVKVNAEVVEKATVFAGDIIELGDCAILVHYNAIKF